jgi:uncharacterized iron-regulated protein
MIFIAVILVSVECVVSYGPALSRRSSSKSQRNVYMRITHNSNEDADNIPQRISSPSSNSVGSFRTGPITPNGSQREMMSRGLRSVLAAGSAVIGGAAFSSSARAVLSCSQCGQSDCPGCASVKRSLTSNGGAWYNPVNERIFDTYHKSYLPAKPEVYLSKDRLGDKRVITVGEVHSNPCHHRLEFDLVKALSTGKRGGGSGNLAIGLECFYRQQQASLDKFVFGHRDFGTLKKETSWDSNWGYDLNYYAKIFNFAAKHGIRLVGLNLPYQVARYVGQVGLDNVPKELRERLPEIDLNVKKHRDQFERALGRSPGHGGGDPEMMSRMYLVQTLWDEYMAESAVLHLEKHPRDTMMVIAGLGHVVGRVGIPDRIARRLKSPSAAGPGEGGLFRSSNFNTNPEPFVIVPQEVNWNADSGLPDVAVPLTSEECDWAWYTEKEIGTETATGTA